jgi:dTDP-4-amino-4,6-dideoxygalactose transaminase
MEWKITLADPDIGDEEIAAVINVLRSKWLTMGRVTEEFESRFAEKMQVKHALAVTNCTAALHLANLVLGIGHGDEVICPDLTFVATANATRYTGADVVFADVISERDLTICPYDIEKKITARTKAITVVHYAGFPCRMDEILEIAQRYRLRIIEDCAHAPFARHRFRNGTLKYVGAIGDVGCFSFYGNKNMTTGEGGMITTNDDAIAEKLRLLRSHGMTSLAYERHRRHVSGYDVVELGYNYRIDEIRASLGLAQLDKIDLFNHQRRAVYSWYVDALKDHPNILVPFEDRDLKETVPHIMPVILAFDPKPLLKTLQESGIQTSKHYDLISSFTLYRRHHCPSKVGLIGNIVTLPMYPTMIKENVLQVTDVLKQYSQRGLAFGCPQS